MNRRAKTGAIVVLLIGFAAIAGYYFWMSRAKADNQKYRTEAVGRGDITQVISANGTLNPVVLVNVGTQVSGTIQKLYVDFNSPVQTGQVLAELDPALFNAAVRQSEANLESALANLKLADIKEKRTRELVSKGFITRQELDQAVQGLDAARAQVSVARAQLEKDRTNQRYTVIKSPIAGVVVARNVDLGQTVAASFNTPTLFQIAKDLREMQIDTSIAEADIGGVKVAQPVRFRVDAFGGRFFNGKVKQIRLNPTIQSNVVTYNVVVAVDNDEGKLMPGMTAYVQINVDKKENVLRVPNTALRFKPAETADSARDGKAAEAKPGEARAGTSGQFARPGTRRDSAQRVYRLVDGSPVEIAIKTGLSDNNFTEVQEGELREGDLVITRETVAKTEPASGAQPRVRMF